MAEAGGCAFGVSEQAQLGGSLCSSTNDLG
jgi:hypothetical protein